MKQYSSFLGAKEFLVKTSIVPLGTPDSSVVAREIGRAFEKAIFQKLDQTNQISSNILRQ